VEVLTIKDRIDDPEFMERAFRLGGDDYVSKRAELKRVEERMGLTPTEYLERKGDIEELITRIRARLPRQESRVEFGGYLRVDLARLQVHVNEDGDWTERRLAPKEFVLLEALVKGDGRPVGKNQLMDFADIDGEGALQNLVWKLRGKLEPDPRKPRFILTYHKIAYRFGGSG
jgi:DNA-binding response OmpR family regulator